MEFGTKMEDKTDVYTNINKKTENGKIGVFPFFFSFSHFPTSAPASKGNS